MKMIEHGKKTVLFLTVLCSLVLGELPKLAIVIDDVGYSLEQCKILLKIKQPITLGVMPNIGYSKKCALEIKKTKHHLLIHFPFDYLGPNYQRNYPVRIDRHMDKATIGSMITKAISSVPNADGINNHMGSYASQNERMMDDFMSQLAKFKDSKYFLDSHTSNQSKAYNYAVKYGIAAAKNNVFLDGVQSEAYIDKQFKIAVKEAQKRGYAVAICHGNRPVTLRVLKKLINQYNSAVDFVYLPEIIRAQNKTDEVILNAY